MCNGDCLTPDDRLRVIAALNDAEKRNKVVLISHDDWNMK